MPRPKKKPDADPGPARTPAGGFWIQAGFVGHSGRVVPPVRLKSPPSFIPAHTAMGRRTNPRTGKVETEWHVPDQVKGADWMTYTPKRGKIDEIRAVDDQRHVEEIEALDAEEESLCARLREVREERSARLAMAWALGRPVEVEDVKPKAETPS